MNGRTVTLRGGVTVPEPALRLALALEARGFACTVDAEGRLQVAPDDRLGPAGRRAVAVHHDALVALLRYCDEVPSC